jgi:phosphatidate cytidylyltransferase
VVYLHGWFAAVAVALIGVLCVHEMLNAVSHGTARPMRAAAYAFAALLFPAYHFAGGLTGIAALFMLCVIAVCVLVVVTGRSGADGAATVLPMVYPGLFLGALVMVLRMPEKAQSQFLLIMAFGAAIVTDSFAYFCGRLLGRHKLAPAISPKKTVEGAVGGTVFGAGAVVALGLLLQPMCGLPISPWIYVALGLVLSVLSQIGDLTASVVKRQYGVKDYGRIMGPHGGAMDRLDSVLFISPAVLVFYYLIAS